METTKILNLAQYIDHTLLKPEATSLQINSLCQEALEYKFKGVCVNSKFVSFASSLLQNSGILTISVVGFPLGACLTKVKIDEAVLAESYGANELDMVLSVGAIKDGLWDYVEQDIQAVTKAVSIPVKVILETGLLENDEIVKACKIAEIAGAKFVKTCTGFAVGGATVEHIKLMRNAVSGAIQVKASGGIKSLGQAEALIAAGATRLGTSSGVQLVSGEKIASQSY
jgi:deoxyribose-phosphate aldolase